MLGAISIRLRQARLERERETHTHTHRGGGGKAAGREAGAPARMHMHSPLPPSRPRRLPAPPTAPRGRPVGGCGEEGGAGWLAGGSPPGLREPVPSPPRRRPFLQEEAIKQVPTPGDGCANLPSPSRFRGVPWSSPFPTLCSSRGCYFLPAELAWLTSRLLFLFFFNSQFLFSSPSESTSPVPGMAPPQSQQALGSKNPDLNVNIGQVCPCWKSLEAGHTELRALKK